MIIRALQSLSRLRGGQVVCEVENRGRLANAIADQAERQPMEPESLVDPRIAH